jgi:hypothetical protein
MFFYLNNPEKKQMTGNDYGIFNQKQSKTESAKTIANLIQMPVLDIDVTLYHRLGLTRKTGPKFANDERKTQFGHQTSIQRC